MDVTVNNAQCIQSMTHIGETIYYNVCTHTTQIVPWGIGQWLSGIIILICILLFISGISFMVMNFIVASLERKDSIKERARKEERRKYIIEEEKKSRQEVIDYVEKIKRGSHG